MEICEKVWRESSSDIFNRLELKKEIYFERKNETTFEYTLKNFKKAAYTKTGAAIMAVSRGKWTEGIDFIDDLCRAVFFIGVPYMNPFDKKILLKKKYLK